MVRWQTNEIFLNSEIKVPDQVSKEHECPFKNTYDDD